MIIKELVVGPIMANCYIAGCPKTLEAVVIDPGADSQEILLALADAKLTVRYLINTHGHFDHVGANNKMKSATGAPILIHQDDEPMLATLSASATMFGMRVENSPPADQHLNDGDTVRFGEQTLRVIHTPGHSPGGVALFSEEARAVFVGDTLFAGSIGRTDLPGGDYNTLIAAIQQKLFPLGDDVTVYCGHGPTTTIGREKKHNPFAALR